MSMTWPKDAISLPACPTEDSTECFWDATVHGNGLGDSFFEHDGSLTQIHVPLGHHIDQVTLTAQNGTYADAPGYGVTFTESAGATADALAQTGGDLFTGLVLAAYAALLILVGGSLLVIALKNRRHHEDTR